MFQTFGHMFVEQLVYVSSVSSKILDNAFTQHIAVLPVRKYSLSPDPNSPTKRLKGDKNIQNEKFT